MAAQTPSVPPNSRDLPQHPRPSPPGLSLSHPHPAKDSLHEPRTHPHPPLHAPGRLRRHGRATCCSSTHGEHRRHHARRHRFQRLRHRSLPRHRRLHAQRQPLPLPLLHVRRPHHDRRGCRGQTESEMARVLHLGVSDSPHDRAIAPIHAAHAALARCFQEAAGSTDPKLRKELAKLRAELDEANEHTDNFSAAATTGARPASRNKRPRPSPTRSTPSRPRSTASTSAPPTLWVEQTSTLVPDYIKTISQFYTRPQDGLRPGTAAGFEQLNFLKDPKPPACASTPGSRSRPSTASRTSSPSAA